MPVKGNVVLPSRDTSTPEVPVDGKLTPEWFDIPQNHAPFAPKELAGYLGVSSDEILGLIECGQLLAFPVYKGQRTTWRIPYKAVALYFLHQQGASN